MDETNKVLKIRGYVFKRGLVWIGWLLEHNPIPPIPYCDDVKTISMEPEYRVSYFTFGLTSKSVIRKLARRVRKEKKK